MARTISHEWAKRTSEILFLSLEHKFHILSPPCYIPYTFITYFIFWFRVGIFIFFLISMQHVITWPRCTFHSAILPLGHKEEELSTACRAAADALEILSNLRPGFPRNKQFNGSLSQANSGERQVNDEELQASESAVQSSPSSASSSSIQARLTTLFPTVGSNRASRKDTGRRPAKSKRTIQSTKGRPSKTLGSSLYSQSQNQQSAYTYNPTSVRRDPVSRRSRVRIPLKPWFFSGFFFPIA